MWWFVQAVNELPGCPGILEEYNFVIFNFTVLLPVVYLI